MSESSVSQLGRRGEARSRLRDFQARLAQRIAQAHAVTGAAPRLAVRAGKLNLLFELADTGEIVSLPPALTKVPHTKPWFRGLANVRGQLVGIADLGQFFGLPATPIDAGCRAVLLAPALGVNAAVLATRVLGLRNMEDLSAEPTITDAISTEYAEQRWRDSSGGQWTELKLASLAASEKFLQIGA